MHGCVHHTCLCKLWAGQPCALAVVCVAYTTMYVVHVRPVWLWAWHLCAPSSMCVAACARASIGVTLLLPAAPTCPDVMPAGTVFCDERSGERLCVSAFAFSVAYI